MAGRDDLTYAAGVALGAVVLVASGYAGRSADMLVRPEGRLRRARAGAVSTPRSVR